MKRYEVRIAEIIDNDEDPTPEEADELFLAMYGRCPDSDDRQAGVFSLVMAGFELADEKE